MKGPVLLSLAVIAACATTVLAAPVTFHLIPKSQWPRSPAVENAPSSTLELSLESVPKSSPYLEHALAEGQAFLYREGEYVPSLVVPLGQEVEVPAGAWAWIGEAPGFVTVEGAVFSVSADQERPGIKVWPAVPACRLALDPSPDWMTIDRLDVVALRSGAVFPIVPSHRRHQWVPKEELLAYSVARGELLAIEKIGRCSTTEDLSLKPLSPPALDLQSLLVRAVLPEDVDLAGEPIFAAFKDLRAPQPEFALTFPSAVVRQHREISLFFLDAPADRDLELWLRHPRLRTHLARIKPYSRIARELSEIRLKRRRSLRLEIEYLPRQQHREARLKTMHCGRSIPATSNWQCREVATANLLPGERLYEIHGLDDGVYLLHAEIDDEIVWGLGHEIAPILKPESDAIPEIPRVLLVEHEISGSILERGRPIPGSVILERYGESDSQRIFSTSSALEYHVFYFGQWPRYPSWIPKDDWNDRPPEDNLGIFGFYNLVACSANGYCWGPEINSRIRGSGELDIEVGTGAKLRVQVRDAETGEPIEGAFLNAPQQKAELRFDGGRAAWLPVAENVVGNTPYLSSGQDGVIRAARLHSGKHRVAVIKPGYTTFRSGVELRDGAVLDMTVGLEREDIEEGVPIELPDGRPASGAYALAISRSGQKDFICSKTTGRSGHLTLTEPCLQSTSSLAIFHLEAAISFFDSSVLDVGRIVLDARPRKPLRVRVVDDEGLPLAGVPIELRYPQTTIGPQDLIGVMAYLGSDATYRTNSSGELVLHLVGSESPFAPDVAILGEGPVTAQATWMFSPGETIELTFSGG